MSIIEFERGWEIRKRQIERQNLCDWILLLCGAILIIVAACIVSQAEELPDSPHLSMRPVIETYQPDERMIVHNSPAKEAKQPRIFDWSFITGHAVYGTSVAFDDYMSARNVGVCAFEGNPDMSANPRSRSYAIHGVVEFAAVLGGDAALKWFGRKQGVPRWLNMIGGNMGATIGMAKHVAGGEQWVKLCY